MAAMTAGGVVRGDEPQATVHVVGNATVLVVGDVAYVHDPAHGGPVAVRVSSACAYVALREA